MLKLEIGINLHIQSKLLKHTFVVGASSGTETGNRVLTCTFRASCYSTRLSWALVLELKLEIGFNMHIQSKLL